MGHVRLGNLPRTKAWKEVVSLIANGADVTQVADATLKAAEKAFQFLKNDKGFKEAVWLLTQIGITGKTETPFESLRDIGVRISDNPSLPELTAAVSEALDDRLKQARAPSDFAEMAQRAIGGTLNQNMANPHRVGGRKIRVWVLPSAGREAGCVRAGRGCYGRHVESRLSDHFNQPAGGWPGADPSDGLPSGQNSIDRTYVEVFLPGPSGTRLPLTDPEPADAYLQVYDAPLPVL